jgi:SAM-dependent methyltransferase
MLTTAREAYETLAPGYDELTSANDYELWLGETLLPELERRGLRHGRVLDAGCGTGRAFEPLLRRGWEVVGCDLSPAMLAEARRKFPEIPMTMADLRELPVVGAFDLVLCLNDVVNYLTEDGGLERAVARMAANLAPGGFLLFDANTLELFRRTHIPDASAGGTFEMTVEGAGVEAHVHRQRHFPGEQLREALGGAGLEAIGLLGQREQPSRIELREGIDQERDQKVVCLGRKPG